MLRHAGMCHQNGSVLCKKSLNVGPIFHEEIPNYGSDFQNIPESKPQKILRLWCVSVAKSQEMGAYFRKDP